MGNLYHQDIYLWSREQSTALRKAASAGSNLSIDWENVAEEIESLGRSERSSLRSQIRRALEHLMKLRASPTQEPRRGWVDTVTDAQAMIEDVLEASPSLRHEVAAIVAREIPRARKIVTGAMSRYGEIPTVGLESLDFTEEQVLGWCPDV